MSNPVVSWASEHPVGAGVAAIGIVVVALVLFGGGGGGGGNAGSVQAYYQAVGNQAQAGAAVQMAQIQADTTKATTLLATNYALQHDQLAAQVATQHDQLAAQVAEQTISTAASVQMQQIASNERLTADSHNIAMAAFNSKKLDSAGRAAVLESAFTGQVVQPSYKPSNPGNSASSIIGAIGGLVSSVGGFFGL